MIKNGKLTADNGAYFEWTSYMAPRPTFYFNAQAVADFTPPGKEWATEIMYGDYGDGVAWGRRGDFGHYEIVVLYNIGLFIKKYPETEQQFLQYMKDCSSEKLDI